MSDAPCDDALVTLGRLLMHVGWTLVVPGAGQGALGKRWSMTAWAIAGLVAAIAFTWTMWAAVAAVGVRVASAGDAALRLRRHAGTADDEDKNLPLYASLVAVVGFVFFQFATDRFAIPSDSMSPTIAVGDAVYIEKVTKRWRAPARGDVVVFAHPCEKTAHIKRVVAVAGDTVEVRCSKLYVNGQRVIGFEAANDAKDFPSLDRLVRSCQSQTHQAVGVIVETKQGVGPCELQLHYVVPAASLFVLGDNRAISIDSRAWGVVPIENVTGRAIGIAWPLSRFGSL